MEWDGRMINMKVPLIRDILFVLKKVKNIDEEDLAKKAWIVGILMLIAGIVGFVIHVIVTII